MANPKLKVDPAHTDAAPGPAPAFHFSVRAVADPSVLSRVVEQFVLRNLVPESVQARRRGPDELQIDLGVTGLGGQEADHVAALVRGFPTVTGVMLQRS